MSEPFRKNPPLTSFRGTVIRWTLICTVCAAPSFYFGFASIASRYIPSMLLGVATFIVFYIALDWGTRFHPLRRNRWVHGGLVFGFTTRLLISVIPPAFMFIDGLTGMYSIRIGMRLFGRVDSFDSYEFGSTGLPPADFVSAVQVYITTIIQGIFLNLMLYLWIILVVGIVWSIFSLINNFKRMDEPDWNISSDKDA